MAFNFLSAVKAWRRAPALAFLASVAAVGPAAADTWSGFYAGGSIGKSSGDADSKVALSDNWSVESAGLRSDVVNGWSRSLEPDGTSFAAHVGVNQQWDQFVFGAEFGLENLGAKEASNRPSTPTASVPSLSYAFGNSVDVGNSWSLRGRVGYDFGGILPYVSVGYQSAEVEATAQVLSNGNYSKLGRKSEWSGGVSYGAGVETQLGGGWSIRGEYQRIDLGDVTFNTAYRTGSAFQTTPPYTETVKQDVTLNNFRVGASFRF